MRRPVAAAHSRGVPAPEDAGGTADTILLFPHRDTDAVRPFPGRAHRGCVLGTAHRVVQPAGHASISNPEHACAYDGRSIGRHENPAHDVVFALSMLSRAM